MDFTTTATACTTYSVHLFMRLLHSNTGIIWWKVQYVTAIRFSNNFHAPLICIGHDNKWYDIKYQYEWVNMLDACYAINSVYYIQMYCGNRQKTDTYINLSLLHHITLF